MRMKACAILFSLIAALALCQGEPWTDEETTREYWNNLAAEDIDAALHEETYNNNVARNVIIFLGDGMGIPSVTAGRILKGQMQGNSGEETVSAMDTFPHTGFSKTYAVDRSGTDSAASATAYLCGVKANYHTAGVGGKVLLGNCESAENGKHDVESVLVDAYRQGKSTGLVTTTRIIHASPSGLYAHTADRNWYADSDLPNSAQNLGCKDIAQQFYDSSDMINVALGGGRKYFRPREVFDEEYTDVDGDRDDGQDLVQMWLDKHGDENPAYVWNRTAFNDIDPLQTDRLLGLFEPGDMNFEVDRDNPGYEYAGEPSVAEMTEKAIQILQKNPKGYFLFVEGGRIDHGHHGSDAYRSLNDFVAFDNAIQKAKEMTSESDTLIVVTADHSHTFNIGGMSYRGNPLFGLSRIDSRPYLAEDDKPFTSLLYGNGDGWQRGAEGYSRISEIMAPQIRGNLTGVNLADIGMQQQSAVPVGSETHGAEEVMIFARGPMSHLFHKTHENSYIPYVMRYAACIGSDLRHCEEQENPSVTTDTPSKTTTVEPTELPEPIPTVPIVAANFLGQDLDATETTWALYIQFVLCIALCLLSLNTMVVVKVKSKNANFPSTIPLTTQNGKAYTKFENGKV